MALSEPLVLGSLDDLVLSRFAQADEVCGVAADPHDEVPVVRRLLLRFRGDALQ